ncbi:MAG TPA: glycosyltransferase family 2 protein [Hyphomonadaceae bacterium]|nr:glycosyltransferase family 2 protein [Hyphomonadaceae bacterium]HPI46817.1 glycosyltransferase family 2 protein [Hyphomonadaceae bacterium]
MRNGVHKKVRNGSYARNGGAWLLRPSTGVRFLGSGVWLAKDNDPQFEISPPEGPIRPGAYEITISTTDTSETPLRPRIYFDFGDGYTEANSTQLPSMMGSGTFLIEIPQRTHRVRFDPIAASGRFILHDISARRVSLMDAVGWIRRQPNNRQEAIAALLSGGPYKAMNLSSPSRSDVVETMDYQAWLRRHEPSVVTSTTRIQQHLKKLPRLPTISIVMPAYSSRPAWLREAVECVRNQVYPNWELCVVDDCSPDPETYKLLTDLAKNDARIKIGRLPTNSGISAATNAALAMATGEWVAFMDHDDVLRGDALALIADAIATNPKSRIIYTDEDKIDENGARSDPYMKGGWNRELFYAQNFINHLTVIRRDVINQAGPLRPGFDGSQDYDLLLRCIEIAGEAAIHHVPFICYHWRFANQRVNFSMTQGDRAFDAAMRALNEHFTRTRMPAVSQRVRADANYTRVKWFPENAPLVSLIIPTRDRRAILETAVRSIREKTTYSNYEILIVDNDSTDPSTLAYFETLKKSGAARIIPAPGPFNFSRINNIAAREARGEILGLINNDVEVRNGEWLEEMVSHFALPDVGATGAKLYYPDGRIQHAGVVTGIGGVAGHLYKLAAEDAEGPFSLLRLPRETTCATAACLLVRADLFNTVGGLDEENLTVAFNDIDLCMKIRAAGKRIIWTPFAELTHHESVSRGQDTDPDKQIRFQNEVRHMLAKWGKALDKDPYYSPNLTLTHEDSSLAAPPRSVRPWD